MKTTTIFLIGIFVLLFSFGLSYYFLSGFIKEPSTKLMTNNLNTVQTKAAVKINYSNIETELPQNQIIQALPNDARILIKFYNFNSGQRTWEKNYSLTKGAVNEGTVENPDVILSLDSEYLNELTTQNFCDVIKQAKSDSNLGIEIPGSKTALLLKYSGMLQYKSCLGL